MARTIHFPALHLTDATLNGLITRAIRHADLAPDHATNILLGHLAALQADLTDLMDACEGKKYAQIDPDGLTWLETPDA